MKQLSELLMSNTVLTDIQTALNSNLQIVSRRAFASDLRNVDGSEKELKLEDSRGSWHKVSFVESGLTYWLQVRTYQPLSTQLELQIGLKQG